MPSIEIKGMTGRCIVHLEGRLAELDRFLPDAKTFLITDPHVRSALGKRCPSLPILETGTGEAAKTLEGAARLYDGLLRLGCDRSSFIVGMGGGVVCDLTGFVAATFMRGIAFGLVPTTLLAQVDAAIGGKNGVNFKGYKNMVGVFRQPRFVLCDPETLSSLPEAELRNGLAEAVKHGAIAAPGILEFIRAHLFEIRKRRPGCLGRLVAESVRVKAAVVNRDEKEEGPRRLLNFGHTFGHALEKTVGISHGEAVSLGMTIAAGLSVERGLLDPEEARRLNEHLSRLGLPTAVPQDPGPLLRQITRDKKRTGDRIHFVWLRRLGNALVEPLSFGELEEITNLWWRGVKDES